MTHIQAALTPHSTACVIDRLRARAISPGAALASMLAGVALRGSDILNAKLLGAPRQQFIEFGLGGPDDLLLQHLHQPVY
jgi:hypothetical protein